MTILFLGNFEGRGWDGSITDENHIAEVLEDLGHEVFRLQRENLDSIIYHSPREYDFTLIAQWDGYGNLAKSIEGLPGPIVYWAFDYQAEGQGWHERLIAESDLYLSKRIADSKYSNWQWLSQDFAPGFLDKYPAPVEKDIDVLFTGSYLPWATERNETIKAVGENFNLVIHSVNEWPQGNEGPVMDERLPELYARAKVVLSIDHTLEAGYWSDRNAQIMACGRAPLFKYVPMSEATFGSHAIYFYTLEGCLEVIQDLLDRNQDEDMDSADQHAYEFAHNNLMVSNRVDNLIRIVDNYICQNK